MLSRTQAENVLKGLESGIATVLHAHANGMPVEKCRGLYDGLGMYLALLRSHFEPAGAPGKKASRPAGHAALISK